MSRIEFLLNGQEGLSGDEGKDYLVVEIIVDNKPLTNFQWFATDLGLLTRSVESSSHFYRFTDFRGPQSETHNQRPTINPKPMDLSAMFGVANS